MRNSPTIGARSKIQIDRIVYLPRSLTHGPARQSERGAPRPDRARCSPTDIKAVQSDPKLKLSSAIELGYQGITLNVGKDKTRGPLGQSAKVRQALDLSIDREAINQVVFNGEFKPGNQWLNPDHPYYQKAFPVRGRDVAKAKALLKDAGSPRLASISWCRRARKPKRSRRWFSRWHRTPASTCRSESPSSQPR